MSFEMQFGEKAAVTDTDLTTSEYGVLASFPVLRSYQRNNRHTGEGRYPGPETTLMTLDSGLHRNDDRSI